MHRQYQVLIVLFTVLFLSACAYPQSEREKMDAPRESQIQMVQTALDQYESQNDGLLPFKTDNEEQQNNSREYLEYQVDFNKLVPDYLADIPTTAYENGGHYQFVIVNEEKNPTVKIADLRIIDEIRSLTTRLNVLSKHIELDEEIGPNVYKVDLNHYHLDHNPTVESPYTGEQLNIYFNGGEEFLVDYRSDVQKIIDENNLEFETGDDVREVLYNETPVVPIYSPELTVDENNNVIFMTSKHKNEKR